MVAGLLIVIVIGAIAGLGPPLLTQHIIDDTLPKAGSPGDPWLLNALIIVMLALVIVSALIGVAQSFLSNSIGQAVMYDLRKRLYTPPHADVAALVHREPHGRSPVPRLERRCQRRPGRRERYARRHRRQPHTA